MSVVRREDYKFCQDICIPCYLTDKNTVLRPSSFMDLAQEIAYWAAQELGFGYDTLHVHHTAWVLSRMHIHFGKAPLWRDEVTLFTWHKGASSLFYLRDFEMKDKEGKTIIDATSSWVVIDEQTRRLVRPEDLKNLTDVGDVDNAIEEPAPRLMLPTDMEPAGEHVVAYSDLDILGHSNNPRYVVWAMDCLPEEERYVKDLYINFTKETHLGETVQLFRHKSENRWWVEGRVEGKTCFSLELEY